MDALTLRASLTSQRDAAQWYREARRWLTLAEQADGAHLENMVRFAAEDQQIAAKFSLADRAFRGLEV